MSMKESQSEASPDLDAGWDELESLSPQAPARRDSEDDFASIFAVDEGWETEHTAAKPAPALPLRAPHKAPARPEVARQPAPSQILAPSVANEPVRAPDPRNARAADPRGLSKKQRRELERQGRAHASRATAERKERAKGERKARRAAEQQRLAAERARLEAARRAEEEQRKQERAARPKKPSPKRNESVAAEKPRSEASPSLPRAQRKLEPASPSLSRAQRKLEQKLDKKKAGREKSRIAADLSPWLFAVAILAIVAVLALLKR